MMNTPFGLTVCREAGRFTVPFLEGMGFCASWTTREHDLGFEAPGRPAALRRLKIDARRLVCPSQVHGDRIAAVGRKERGRGAAGRRTALPATDALITKMPGTVLSILTADCLPVFLAASAFGGPGRSAEGEISPAFAGGSAPGGPGGSAEGEISPAFAGGSAPGGPAGSAEGEISLASRRSRGPAIGLIHAGWRGLGKRIVAKAVRRMTQEYDVPAGTLTAVLGPAIRPCCYEVGDDFLDAFPGSAHPRNGRVFLDLAAEAALQLVAAGVPSNSIFDSRLCTCCSRELFFSYRRDGQEAGRSLSTFEILEPALLAPRAHLAAPMKTC